MTTMLWIWVAIICASAIVEAISTDMTSIWITCGGIVGIILYAIFPDKSVLIQIIPAAVVTILLIIFIRPIVKRMMKNKTTKTNADSLVGQRFKLLTDIKPDAMGTVKINGVVWSVESEDADAEINAGTEIVISQIKGNKLVAKAEQKQTQDNSESKNKKNKEEKEGE